MIFVATGVTNGDLLRGVRFMADSARTHSLIMCMRCNWVRFTDGIHFRPRAARSAAALIPIGQTSVTPPGASLESVIWMTRQTRSAASH